MKRQRIQLGRQWPNGIYASILNEDPFGFDDEVIIASHARCSNPKRICALASERLRALADAFDRLATMKDPLNSSTQKAVMKGDNQ